MTEHSFNLLRKTLKDELHSKKVSRGVLNSVLDHEGITLEKSIIAKNSFNYGLLDIKESLKNLVNEGVLDTGYEAGVRWYCLRKECVNHFTGEIKIDSELRYQLKDFIEIY